MQIVVDACPIHNRLRGTYAIMGHIFALFNEQRFLIFFIGIQRGTELGTLENVKKSLTLI